MFFLCGEGGGGKITLTHGSDVTKNKVTFFTELKSFI